MRRAARGPPGQYNGQGGEETHYGYPRGSDGQTIDSKRDAQADRDSMGNGRSADDRSETGGRKDAHHVTDREMNGEFSGGHDTTMSYNDRGNNNSNINNNYNNNNTNGWSRDKNGVEEVGRHQDSYNTSVRDGDTGTHLATNGDVRDETGREVKTHYSPGRARSSQQLAKGQKKGPAEKVPSVRRRHYDHMDISDVIQDKLATQLRENGVAETRVPMLSAKLAQAVRDDVMDGSDGTQPQVSQQLREAIHTHLDPLLHNKSHVTDLSQATRPRDAPHLAQMVMLRLGQVHEEAESCRQSVGDLPKSSRKGYTPRDESDRSILLQIKEGVEHMRTEGGILQEKLDKTLADLKDSENDREKQQKELEELGAENWQLATDLREADRLRENLQGRLREQQTQYEKLDKTCADLRAQCAALKKQLEESDTSRRGLSGELSKLQSDRARLQVLLEQKEKEILHLRDPDKDMLHNMRLLQDEVTLLRTQTRRLNEEKGMLKSKSQRMESSLEETQKARNRLTAERDSLLRENQELRQRYRKVAGMNGLGLGTAPQTRQETRGGLPDISTGRNSQAVSPSRVTSRATSRAYRSPERQEMHRTNPRL